MAFGSNHIEQQPDPVRVLTGAVTSAADLMGFNKAMLAKILGISAASAGRLYSGQYRLNPHAKEWDMALLLVRLFRSLDAIMAGDEKALRSWLASHNLALNAKPTELVTDAAGLVHIVDYVDSYRARV
ncbi:MAG: MbcA/ParS/Xre antitoxin family protein [Gammaproteobacteria bacterium]|nr:MbcA/ParS/Xre antitoxin family protein [Gammaproteobacteria bacterium]